MAADRRVSFIIGANIQSFQKGMDQAAKRLDRFGKKMERTGQMLTTRLTLPIIAMGAAAAKSAIDFESAFAGVRKTVDATEAEFATLRKGILDMSKQLPTSANEIAGVAEAAGQLGIETQNILEFSRTMVMLGDTTNMAADEAATSLARIANVMQLPQDQFDRIGSTIVDLGNNFATTEAEITEFATRIAGAGKVAGLSASQVFAIGTALSSVGIRAESGGTAVQKALLNMNDAVVRGNDSLDIFAKTAGMTAEEFQTAWRDDSGEAFTAFVNGLGRAGDGATKILSDVGLNSERVRATFLSLSGAGDLLNRTMGTSVEAWQENNALTKEAEERYKTFQARLDKFMNKLTTIGIRFGDMILPALEKLMNKTEDVMDAMENMSEGTRLEVLKMATLLAVSGPLLLAVGKAARIIAGFATFVFSRFGLITGVLVATIGTTQWFVDNWELLFERAKTAVKDFFSIRVPEIKFGGIIGDEVQKASEALSSLFGQSGGLERNVKNVDDVMDSAFNSIAIMTGHIEYLGNRVQDSSPKFTSWGESFQKALSMMGDGLLELTGLDEALERFNELFKDTGDTAEEAGDKIETSLKKIRLPSLTADMEITPPDISHVEGDFKKIGVAGDEAALKLNEFRDDLADNIAPTVGFAVADMAESFFAGMAKIATTGGTLKTVFHGILDTLAELAIRVGKIAIGVGIAIEGVKKALQSLNPIAAIAAGGALIALGTIAKTALANAAKAPEPARMASGGIVPSGFPNDTYPAMLSSGETVIPAPKSLPRGGQTIHTIVNLDSRVVWESMKDYEHELRS